MQSHLLPVINSQPPEKRSSRDDGALEVVSVFDTIQGEGPFVGRPAVFVRLAGCNLMCPGCDTDYTTGRVFVTPDELADKVDAANTRMPKSGLVVLTGGEPFRQNCGQALRRLMRVGYNIQIETNGTLYDPSLFGDRYSWLPETRLSIVGSPKTASLNTKLMPYIDHLKYILRAGEVDEFDGLPTSSLLSGVRPCRPWESFRGTVYVQPFDEGKGREGASQANVQAAIESCMRWGYTLSLQTHKILNLP